MLKAPLRPP